MNKPYSYIMIPDIVPINEDDKVNLIELIMELRTYGFKSSEDIVSETIKEGTEKKHEPEGGNSNPTNSSNVGKLIQKLEAELEAVEEAELNSKLSKLDYLKKKYGE